MATAPETWQSAWQGPLLLLLRLLQFLRTAVFLHVPRLSVLLAKMRRRSVEQRQKQSHFCGCVWKRILWLVLRCLLAHSGFEKRETYLEKCENAVADLAF